MAYVNFGRKNTRAQALASQNKDKVFFPIDDTSIILDGKEYGVQPKDVVRRSVVSVIEYDGNVDTQRLSQLEAELEDKATKEELEEATNDMATMTDVTNVTSTLATKREVVIAFEGVDEALKEKATKDELTNGLKTKADKSTTYTKAEVDASLQDKLETSSFTKENIKNTLGISDWALEQQRPVYDAHAVGAYSTEQIDEMVIGFSETLEGINTDLVSIDESKADKSAIPTKVSQLENDSNYLTQHQDISGLATKSEVGKELNAINRSLASKADTTDIPDVSGFANKTDIPDISGKADKANTYTKQEVNTAIDESAEVISLEIESLQQLKADKSNTYTKDQVDTSLSGKANKEDVVYKNQVEVIEYDGNVDTQRLSQLEAQNQEMKARLDILESFQNFSLFCNLEYPDAPWQGGDFYPEGECYFSVNGMKLDRFLLNYQLLAAVNGCRLRADGQVAWSEHNSYDPRKATVKISTTYGGKEYAAEVETKQLAKQPREGAMRFIFNGVVREDANVMIPSEGSYVITFVYTEQSVESYYPLQQFDTYEQMTTELDDFARVLNVSTSPTEYRNLNGTNPQYVKVSHLPGSFVVWKCVEL